MTHDNYASGPGGELGEVSLGNYITCPVGFFQIISDYITYFGPARMRLK